MLRASAMAPVSGVDRSIQPLQSRVEKQETSPRGILNTKKFDNFKKKVNYAVNGGASIVGLFAFINGNFHLFDSLQEKIEGLSEVLTRVGTGVSGFIGALDVFVKKNVLSFVGYDLMASLPMVTSGYNLWLARGVSSGLINFLFVVDRREVVDDLGEPKMDKQGKIEFVNGDFSSSGWWKSFTVSFQESVKMLKELRDKPERIKKFTHSTLVTSLLQILGPIPGFLGFEKIGSALRNSAGVGSFIAMSLDKGTSNGLNGNGTGGSVNGMQKGLDLRLPLVQCNLLRIGTSILDFLKRFESFTSKVSNLTEISLALDRIASLLYVSAVFDIKKR